MRGLGLGPAPALPSPKSDFLSSLPLLAPSLAPSNPVEDLLTAACSSIFPGAGTNQELALHCLHESRGDILVRHCPWCWKGLSGRLAWSQACWHADLRQTRGADQVGGCRCSTQGSPSSRLCCSGSSYPPQSLILGQWVSTLRKGCH